MEECEKKPQKQAKFSMGNREKEEINKIVITSEKLPHLKTYITFFTSLKATSAAVFAAAMASAIVPVTGPW